MEGREAARGMEEREAAVVAMWSEGMEAADGGGQGREDASGGGGGSR